MSKHLRFGRLLGLLAVMLTLSFAWAQGQNLSSEKVLGAFKIAAADNSAVLFDDVTATVTEATKEVWIRFPYRYTAGEPNDLMDPAVPLKASFKSSKFSNLFKDQAAPTDLMIGSAWRAAHAIGQGYGNESNAPWILGVTKTYATGDVLTLEAENHSYIYYTVKVTYDMPAASTAKDIVSMEATWMKDWSVPCAALTDDGEATVVISGTNITVTVPFGTDLTNIPLLFVTSPFSVAFLGAAPTTPITPGPDPDSWAWIADLSTGVAPYPASPTGIQIYVYPQAYPLTVTPKIYTVKAVVGIPSELDEMKQLVFEEEVNPELDADVFGVLDVATQTWTVEVPYGVTIGDLKPSWETSQYANMFNNNPLAPGAVEICSQTVLAASTSGHHGWHHDHDYGNWYCAFWHYFKPNKYNPYCDGDFCTWYESRIDADADLHQYYDDLYDSRCGEEVIEYITLEEQFGDDFDGCGSFWVQAEDDSEVSEYPFCVTNAACSDAAQLTEIWVEWTKWTCTTEEEYSGFVKGVIDEDDGTVTFDVPYGVTTVQIVEDEEEDMFYTYSEFAGTSDPVGTWLVDMDSDGNSSINITSQCPEDGGQVVTTYDVILNNEPISSEKQILSFGFHYDENLGLGFNWDAIDYEATGADLDQVNRRITVRVPWVTDLHHLVAFFTTSDYACVEIANTGENVPQTSDESVNDHSNTLTYVITAEDGTQERYQVMVVKTPISSVKSVTDMVLNGLPYCEGVYFNKYNEYDVTGAGVVTINGTNINISVKYGTVINGLNFTITLGTHLCTVAMTNGTIAPAKGEFDTEITGTLSASPATLTVTAQDYSQTVYTITVTPRAVNSDKVLTSYWFKKSPANVIGNADIYGVIDQATRVVTVHVPFGSDVSALKAGFILNDGMTDYPGGAVMTHSEDAQELQVSDVTPNDFRHQVAYTIWAENCSTLEYFVNVIVDENAGNDILNLSVAGLEYPNCKSCEEPVDVTAAATITGTSITVTVPYGTDMTDLHLTASPSAGATISPVLSTINVYTAPITLTVTAANGISTKTYTLTIVKAPALTGAQLLSFGFEKENNGSFDTDRWAVTPINQTTFRIDVKVPFGTDMSALIATFEHSPMSCVYTNGAVVTTDPAHLQCSGVTANSFSASARTYTVKSQSGVETYYNIYVTQDVPLTEKVLSAFNVTNVAYCTGLNISPATYSIVGTGTTAIGISVKAGSTVTNLSYSFTVSATATVTASNGTPVKAGTSVTGTANFTSPVTFTVKAQDNSTQTYVVTVTPRAVNSAKQLTKYAIKNPAGGIELAGTINEAAKTVEVWVPWGTTVTALVANFELNNGSNSFAGGALLTHSELADGVVDKQVIQTSGVSDNDFTTPVAYTVIAEDCSTVEYFVTVRMIPNTDTGISGFNFNVTGCGCNLSTRIDAYARRIYVSVPASMDISNLAPTSIVVTPAIGTRPAATVSPAAGVAQNWTNGPVKYTVTAPDGVTKADWMVYVTNPKCKDTNILTFALPNAQVATGDFVSGFGKPVTIDTVNHKIDVIIKKGVNLGSVYYERTLPCGATICCVGGNCQDNHYLDFSQGGCHTCVVTAEDQTVTQEWTICVHEIDATAPEVITWSVMAYNCTDSVAVQSNELGRVFIVHESAINMNQNPTMCTPLYNLADWTGAATVTNSVAALVANRLGNWATVTAVDTPVYVKTNGLYSGVYWAFSVDAWGHVSCISKEKLFLDMCDVTVATLCDLRNQPDVWRYTLTQEVVVTMEEPKTAGNWKFAQTADCGIMIEDKLNVLPATYGVGTGLTGLKGMLDKSGPMLKLIPVCCYTPTKSSTGNVVTPKNLTYAEFVNTAYNGSHVFESMLVKVTNPLVVNGTGNWAYNLDYGTKDVLATAWTNVLATPFMNVDYLTSATAIPTVPAFFTGLRWDVKPSSTEYGKLVPLKKTHIAVATDPILFGNPNPGLVDGVLPGNCKSIMINVINEGVGNATITALYLDDASATDEFQIVAPPAVPFTVGTWTGKAVEVKFCPLDAGDETTNLIVEYGIGKTLVIPINGKTMIIKDMNYLQDFNSITGNAPETYGDGWTTRKGNENNVSDPAVNDLSVHIANSWVKVDGTPVLNMRPRKKVNGARIPAWTYSPGVNVTGNDPVVTFSETVAAGVAADGPKGFSPLTSYISTDGGATWSVVDTYLTGSVPDAYAGQGWRTKTYSLAAYKGQAIWWKFEVGSVNNEYTYWCIDNFEVRERVTGPIVAVAPATGDFGGVQVGATGTLAFSVKNVGISVLKVKKVAISGDATFTLTDTNTYPFEVTDGPGTWAYTTGASGSALNFSVDFKPTDIGVKTGKVTVTYGLYSDQTVEIALTGEGLSCATATVANKGENWAPSQNTWFKYTADKFSIVEVNSCHPHQQRVGTEYSWDTFLYLYSDCNGTLIASHDDMEAACVYNRASSSIQTVMNAGETIYIFWPLSFPTALHAYEGFYFNINASYPTDGDVCENAIPLTLPVVNHFGTTVGFNDDYNISPCSPFSNYMDGNDKVYTITLPYEGYLTGSLLGAYGSIHVLDLCPKEELEKFHCKAFTGGPTGGNGFDKKIAAGTYFVIISTWAPPQTVDFLLNLSFRGTGVDENALNSTLSVYPNPNSGQFTVSVNNPEATDMTIELVNISGQVVYRNEVKAAYSYNEDIDASTFAKGVYYLKVSDAKGVKVEKVVVQ